MKELSNNYNILKNYGGSLSTSFTCPINSSKVYSIEIIKLKENNVDLCFPVISSFYKQSRIKEID